MSDEKKPNPFRTLAEPPQPPQPVVPPPGRGEEDMIREELERGVLFSSVEKMVNWARANAIWPLGFGLACCAIEMMAIVGPRFDISRFGAATLTPERIEERLRVRFPDAAIRRQTGAAVRDHTLYVPADRLVEICTFLRDDPELDFAMLSWIAGVDWMPRDPRFEVVYGLLS